MKTQLNKMTIYPATCFNPVGSSSDWHLKYINQVYKSYYGREISLLTNYVTRVGTLIVATIYLQLIQNRYMFRRFTVLHCSHQHCLQPVATDVEVVGYL